MKRIVITADDYGVHPEVSGLIIELLDAGLVSATTMLAASPHAADGAAQYRASGLGRERLRLHFALNSPTEGPDWFPAAGKPSSLTDEQGAFWPTEPELESRAQAIDVVAELQAQYDWMAEQGLPPAGIDVHRMIVYGIYGRSFLPEVLGFCARRQLPFRLPHDPTLQFGDDFGTEHRAQLDAALDAAEALGVATPWLIASLPPGADDEYTSYDEVLERYLEILAAIPEHGVSEVFLHPIPNTAHGQQTHVWEAEMLRDPRWQAALDDFKVVTSWA